MEKTREVQPLLLFFGELQPVGYEPCVSRHAASVPRFDRNVRVHRADEDLAHVREIVVLRVLESNVLDRDRRLIREIEQKRLVLVLEATVVSFVEDLEHADDAPFEGQGNAKGRLGSKASLPVEAALESRVVSHVVDERRTTRFRAPARDALARLDVHGFHGAGRLTRSGMETKLAVVVEEQNRAGLGPQGVRSRLYDRLQQDVEVENASESLRDLEDRRELGDILRRIAWIHGLIRLGRDRRGASDVFTISYRKATTRGCGRSIRTVFRAGMLSC